MNKLLEQVETAYVSAVRSNIAADPAKVVPLVDVFMALWAGSQGVPPAVEQDLMQDLMPVLGGPTNLCDAAAKLRADLVAGANQYNLAGAGRAVMRAITYLSSSAYVSQTAVEAVCRTFSSALHAICDRGV